MHMLIRVLVPAVDSSEAVSTARYALDRLIGIGDGSSTEFDYYKTLDESTARYRDHPHYGGLDHVSVMSRERGVFSSNGSQPTYVVERGLRPEAPRRGVIEASKRGAANCDGAAVRRCAREACRGPC